MIGFADGGVVTGRPWDKENVWYYVCLMGIIQYKLVFCFGITLVSKRKCLRAKTMAGDLCDSSRITFLTYESWVWMGVGWSGLMKGLGSSWCLADLSIWNSCLPWALSVGGREPSQRWGDKVAATCCIDQGLQGPQRLVGQIVPLFPYLAWLTSSQESLSGEWSWGKGNASRRGLRESQ